MKKKIIILVVFAFFGLLKANAVNITLISGHITNTHTGLPMPNHLVNITDGNNYNHNVFTDNNGYYHDSIWNNSPSYVIYNVYIHDCNGTYQFDTVLCNGFISKIINFSICNVGNDVGINNIIIPGDTCYLAGNHFYPKIRIINFDTLTVYSIPVAYKINGLATVNEIWTGNPLPSGAMVDYTFLTGFILPNSNFNFCAYTRNNDNNPLNDTICKTVIYSAPSKDAGVTDIILPSDTVHLGDTIYPSVKIKNYGTQTITNLQFYIKLNNQFSLPISWNGSLPHDSSTTVTAGVIYINAFSYLVAYTNLNGDINHFNDSSYKTLTILPPQYDVGTTAILNSLSTVLVGDTIYPKVKFKNFGCQTITSLNLAFKINGITTIENWTGNLSPDSSAIYTFNQYIVCPSNFYMLAFTQLSLDIFPQNDTFLVTFTPLPALRDVGIIDIIVPDLIVCSGSVVYPKVVIKNFGTMPLTSIPVNYQRGTMPVVTETWTSTNPLAYGDTAIYTFTAAFTFPMGSTYEFSSFTSLANDANMLNNKLYEIKLISDQPFLSNVTGDDTVIIGQSNVIYQANGFSGPNAQFIWTLPPGAVSDSAYNNIIIVHYGSNAQNGNISCKIMNACGTSQTIVFPVSVFLTPPPPIIYQNGNNLISGYSTGNQWYYENSAIPGANQPTYTSTQTGHYFCKVTINGLTSYESNTIYVAFTGIQDAFIKSHFEVFPNPTNDKTNFKYALNTTSDVCLKITDIEGRLIQTLVNKSQDKGDYLINFDASMLKKGIYFYQFRAGNSILNGKLIIVN